MSTEWPIEPYVPPTFVKGKLTAFSVDCKQQELVNDILQDIMVHYEWAKGDKPKCLPGIGNLILVQAQVENIGNYQGTLFLRVSDETGQLYYEESPVIASGETTTFYINVTLDMPNTTKTLTIEAGHIEEAGVGRMKAIEAGLIGRVLKYQQ